MKQRHSKQYAFAPKRPGILALLTLCGLTGLGAQQAACAQNAVPAQSGASLAAPAQVTPEISGVVAAGTPIELIKEGFTGTEGPVSLPDGSLLFTETQANRITRIAADGSTLSFVEGSNGSNGLAIAPNGDIYAVQVLKPRVAVVFPEGRRRILVEQYEGAGFGRPNDIVLDKQGGVYFTDSGANQVPGQAASAPAVPVNKPAVYYVSAKGEVKRLANDIVRPNGIQLSPDETVLYVANTAGEYLLAYDITAPGVLGPKREFAKLAGFRQTDNGPSSGADGLAVDAEGRVYVASTAGIQVFSPRGVALGVIPLPKPPQNLAFAGEGKKTLYIVGRGAAYRIATIAQGFEGRAK
jgi:gluconolactonase